MTTPTRAKRQAAVKKRTSSTPTVKAKPAPSPAPADEDGRLTPKQQAVIDQGALQDQIDSQLMWLRADKLAKVQFEAEEQAERAATRPMLEVVTLSELRARPKPDWWITGMVAQSTLVGLIGPQNEGKTFVAADMLACIATGTDWHEHKVRSGRVLYLPGEGVEFFPDRVTAWEQHYIARVDDEDFQVIEEGFNLSDPSAVDALCAIVAEGEYDVICIDTLSQLGGIENENDNAQMAAVVNAAKRIRQARPGSTVILVHHTNKSGGIRGASALEGNLDTVIMLRPGDGDRKGFFSLSTERPGKQKNAERVTLDHFHLVPSGPALVVARKALAAGPYRDAIMAVLADGEWHKAAEFRAEWKGTDDWKPSRYRAAMEQLTGAGIVVQQGTNKAAQYKRGDK